MKARQNIILSVSYDAMPHMVAVVVNGLISISYKYLDNLIYLNNLIYLDNQTIKYRKNQLIAL